MTVAAGTTLSQVQHQHAVQVRAVEKIFDPDVRALDPVTFHLARGEFLSIIGPSGCGKSTLLRIITGLEKPTRGAVTLASSRLAFVFQDAHLLPWRNVLRNVALPLELQGLPRPARLERAINAIEQVRLTDAL